MWIPARSLVVGALLALVSCIDGREAPFDDALIASRIAAVEAAGGVAIFVTPGLAWLLAPDESHPLWGWAVYLPADAMAEDEPGAILFILPAELALPEAPEYPDVGVPARLGLINPLSQQDVPMQAPAAVTAPLRRGSGVGELALAQNAFAAFAQYNGTAFLTAAAADFLVEPQRLAASVSRFQGVAYAARRASTPPTLAQILPTFPGQKAYCLWPLLTLTADAGVTVTGTALLPRAADAALLGLALDYFSGASDTAAAARAPDGLFDLRADVVLDPWGVRRIAQATTVGEALGTTTYKYNFDKRLTGAQTLGAQGVVDRSATYSNSAASVVTRTTTLLTPEPDIVVRDEYHFATSDEVGYRLTVTATATQRMQTWLFRDADRHVTGVSQRFFANEATGIAEWTLVHGDAGIVAVTATTRYENASAGQAEPKQRALGAAPGCRDEDVQALFADALAGTPLGQGEFLPLNLRPEHP